MYSSHIQTPEYPVLFVPKYDGDDLYLKVEDARALIRRKGGNVEAFDQKGRAETFDGYWLKPQ